MMAYTSTTLEGMTGAIQAMDSAISDTRNGLNTVNGEVASLLSVWTGTASQGFNQALNDWEQVCNKIINTMNTMVGVMNTNLGTIRQGEDANASTTRQLAGGMAL